MFIKVFGAGYVGLSNAVMLASKNHVEVIDISNEKIEQLKANKVPFNDTLLQDYLSKKKLNITYSNKLNDDQRKTNVALIATPTNFSETKKQFDVSSIMSVLKDLYEKNFKGLAVIRSTVPIGFTDSIKPLFSSFDIAFFPEFLREGNALQDCLNPSRIICGSKSSRAKKFLKTLQQSSLQNNMSSLITSSSEAEAIKLFSNSFLAMRIAFFNEVDSFAMNYDLDPKKIIKGICLDERIGNYYNNPSFGYGGYCLPKDTKQLKNQFIGIPEKLITAIVASNRARKNFIAEEILNKKPKSIGIYRLSMKAGSDNWRDSSVVDLIDKVKRSSNKIIVYEPNIKSKNFNGCLVENDIDTFVKLSEIIVANRIDKKIVKNKKKVFSRDLFRIN